MKKTILLFLTITTLLLISGCQSINDINPFYEDTTQLKLMETRTTIRASNVGVNVDLFRRSTSGIFERVAGTSKGSGVVFLKDDLYYYALTNFHVIDDTDYARAEYTVMPSSIDTTIEADIYDVAEHLDLAVIRFPHSDLDIPLINLTQRHDTPIRQNELVLAVGNPSAVNSIVTYGEALSMVNITNVDFPVLLHTALIYPGNSGGALTDINGNLLGINTWGTEDNDERNMAVPLSIIYDYLESINLLP